MSGKERKSCLEFIARDLLQVEEGGKPASLSQTPCQWSQAVLPTVWVFWWHKTGVFQFYWNMGMAVRKRNSSEVWFSWGGMEMKIFFLMLLQFGQWEKLSNFEFWIKRKASTVASASDTELPLRETVADGSHQLGGPQLRALGGSDPERKRSLAELALRQRRSRSLLCALGAWSLKMAPHRLRCTVFCLGLAHGRYQQEDEGPGGKRGWGILCFLPALVTCL